MDFLVDLTQTILNERKMMTFQRLAGTIKLRSYHLAEHSYYVGLMFQEMAEYLGIPYDLEVFTIVLRHDMMEVFTTDLPYPVKHSSKKAEEAWDTIEQSVFESLDNPKFVYTDAQIQERLSREQFVLMKLCDLAELAIFCAEEYAMGNTHVSQVIQNCKNLLHSYESEFTWVSDFNTALSSVLDLL